MSGTWLCVWLRSLAGVDSHVCVLPAVLLLLAAVGVVAVIVFCCRRFRKDRRKNVCSEGMCGACRRSCPYRAVAQPIVVDGARVRLDRDEMMDRLESLC